MVRMKPVLIAVLVTLVSAIVWADGTIADGDATVGFASLPQSILDNAAIVTFRIHIVKLSGIKKSAVMASH